jgi:hypothetical protein
MILAGSETSAVPDHRTRGTHERIELLESVLRFVRGHRLQSGRKLRAGARALPPDAGDMGRVAHSGLDRPPSNSEVIEVPTAGLNLAIVLSLIDQSVDAYRLLVREHPLDWGKVAAQRQQEAADLLDRAQTLGGALPDEEGRIFTERFSTAYGTIERLETLRGTYGYDPEEDDDIEAQERLVCGPQIVVRLVGGPFHGQTRKLESLPTTDGEDTAPIRIQLAHTGDREVSMVTYLRDSEPSRGELTYFYVDALDPARSLEASFAMDSADDQDCDGARATRRRRA